MKNILCCLADDQNNDFPTKTTYGQSYASQGNKYFGESTMYSTLGNSSPFYSESPQQQQQLWHEQQQLQNRRSHIESIYWNLRERLERLRQEYAYQEHRLFEINQVMRQLGI